MDQPLDQDSSTPDVAPDPDTQEAALGPSLEALAASLEGDDEDRMLAVEGLASVEPEIRVRIIEGLGELPRGPGLTAFLRALGESDDPETARAARGALHLDPDPDPGPDPEPAAPAAEWLPAIRTDGERTPARHRLVGSLVSAVDGEGQATIAVSSIREGVRRSAVFRCDVRSGVGDAYGRSEAEDADDALGLIDEAIGALPNGSDRLLDVPELALSLLAGTLLLGGRRGVKPSVQDRLDDVLGPGFRPRPIPIPEPSAGLEPADPGAIAFQVRTVLDRCPSWVDASPLTFELAEEIELREGDARPTDPIRHAGAYRYLFEHRLIGRLDLYARMLLWMAWFWRFAGEPGLSDSSIAVAAELVDEQFAVPSHPFAVALTTWSLDEARRLIRTRGR